MQKSYYVGLDVAQKKTQACVVDQDGKVIREKELNTHPAAIIGFIRKHFHRMLPISGWRQEAYRPGCIAIYVRRACR